jgi:hypothetical protein
MTNTDILFHCQGCGREFVGSHGACPFLGCEGEGYVLRILPPTQLQIILASKES